jgi:hypothetical protein
LVGLAPGRGADGKVHVLMDLVGHAAAYRSVRPLHGFVDQSNDALETVSAKIMNEIYMVINKSINIGFCAFSCHKT